MKTSAAPRRAAAKSASRAPGTPSPRGPSWLNLRMIEVFAEVARQDGMTAAAVRLGMTQSAVSQAISSIEAGLGAQLIDRKVRPTRLTLFGEKFLEHATPLLRRARDLEQIVELAKNDRLPLVRIGMMDSLATTIGPSLLRELTPLATRWTVFSGVEHTSVLALTEKLVDVVITSEESAPDPEILSVTLVDEPYMIVAPKELRLRGGGIAELIERLPLLRFSSRAFIGRHVEEYLRRNDFDPPRQFELDTLDAVLAMVRAGLGWTITTPLCVLKAGTNVDEYRYHPLVPQGAVRRVRLLAHRDRYVGLWERVADAARATIEKDWNSRIRRMAPWHKVPLQPGRS